MSDFIDVVRRLLCRRYVAASVVFGLCALTGVAWVLCQPGTLGHHWDWLIPDSPEELRALTRSNFYAWQDFALGSFVSYRYNSTLLAIVLGLPGYLGASGALVSKGLVICTLMGSALTMYALVDALARRLKPDLEPHRYAMVAGILYGFSPFSYNQIVAGDQLEFIAYAIAPLSLLFILRSVEGSAPARVRSMVAAAVCLTVMSASPQTLVLSVLTGLVIVAALNPSLKHVAATMGIILVFTIALCSYWIIPVAFGGDAISEGVATTAQAFADTGLRSMSSLFQTLTTAAEPGSFYLRALPGPLSATFTIAWIMLWVVIATATLLHRHRLVVALAILYVIGSILPLGGAPLVGPVVLGLYHATMPASLLFRTAQHLVFLPTLVAPLLVGICSASVELLNNRFRQIAAVLVLLAVSAGFVVHSDYLALIGPFKKDSNARAATHYVASVAKDQRMLFLPASGSYYFHPGVFDYFFEGGDDPSVRFSPVPTLAPGYKWSPYLRSQVLEKAIDELMLQGGRIDDRDLLLKISSIGFVEALNGVHPAGGVFVDSFNYAHAVHTVGQLPRLRMRSDDAEETLWEVQGSVPRIYVPDCVVRVDQRADAYDLLPWSRLVKKCDAPAFIADEPSDEIIKRASDIRALVEGKGDRWHFGQIGVQLGFEPVGGNSDVEVDRMLDGTSIAKVFAARHYVIVGNLVPAGAFSAAGDPNLTRLDLGLDLPDTGDYLISLLAPDWAHRFEARVTLQAGEQFLIIAPTHLEQVGHPDPRRITQLRLANITPHHLSLRVAKILPPVLYRASTGAAVEPGNAPARLGYLAAVPVVPTFRGASMTPTLAGDGSVTEEVSSRGLVFEGDVHGPDHAMRFGPGQLRTLLAIDAPVPAEYLVSFLAPDWNHRFDARVVVPAGPAKFSLAPGIMDQVGSPRVSRIAVFRVANIT
ncbi:MAG: hypothetical protein M3Z41_05745, partial [Candidatus Eremiobacteraeota bacterium]|nr:hypothetical protein [Candidatus Eremiobacteraeota bacterium]